MSPCGRGKILITGAGGFVGGHLVHFLAARGLHILAASRAPAALRCEGAGFAVAEMPDMRNADGDFASLMYGVDIVVHAAGLTHGNINDERHDPINRASMISLVRAAQDADVRHFVFISSVAAQSGASSVTVLTEDDPPAPDTAYGRSKLAAEAILRESNLGFTILRPVAVHGPNAKGSSGFLEQIAHSPLPLPFAQLNTRRSTLSIENLCSAVLLVLNNQASLGKAFLVADPEPKSVSETVKDIRTRANRRANLFPFPPKLLKQILIALGRGRLAESIDAPLIVSTARLHALGWKPI